eukprot:g4863.t1
MRLVIQRVRSASVSLPQDGNKIAGEIGNGLLVLVGICGTDTQEHLEFCVRRLLRMKLFPKGAETEFANDWGDPAATQWAQSATDSGFGLLIVSQFTLHAKFKKPKPDFHASMGPGPAKDMFDRFVAAVRKEHEGAKKGGVVQTGEFGAMMSVKLENDGPVTMIVDSDLEMGTNAGGGGGGSAAKEPAASANGLTRSGAPATSKSKSVDMKGAVANGDAGAADSAEQPDQGQGHGPTRFGPRPLRPPSAGTSGAPAPGHDLSIVFWKLRDEEQAENKQQDHHAIYGKNSSISVRSVLRFVKKIDPSASPLGIRAVVRAIIEEHCRATRVGPAEANALLREMRITERMFVQTLSTWLATGRDVDIGPLWNALLRDVDGEDGRGTAAETRRGFTPEVFKAGFEAVGEAISVEEARDLLFGPDDAEIGFGSRTSISKDEFRSLLTGNQNTIVPRQLFLQSEKKNIFDVLPKNPRANKMSYPIKAQCLIAPKGKPCGGGEEEAPGCTGIVTFVQESAEKCVISWDLKNCGKAGKHGFHIHEKADFSNGCMSAGPHYNPFAAVIVPDETLGDVRRRQLQSFPPVIASPRTPGARQLRPGDVIGLWGPARAGKTTLIKVWLAKCLRWQKKQRDRTSTCRTKDPPLSVAVHVFDTDLKFDASLFLRQYEFVEEEIRRKTVKSRSTSWITPKSFFVHRLHTSSDLEASLQWIEQLQKEGRGPGAGTVEKLAPRPPAAEDRPESAPAPVQRQATTNLLVIDSLDGLLQLQSDRMGGGAAALWNDESGAPCSSTTKSMSADTMLTRIRRLFLGANHSTACVFTARREGFFGSDSGMKLVDKFCEFAKNVEHFDVGVVTDSTS